MGCIISSAVEKKDVVVQSKVEVVEVFPIEEIRKLHSAIRWNKPVPEVKALLHGPSNLINAVDFKTGNMSLHIAAQNGHLDIVKLLVKSRAALNQGNKNGNTPLHMAIGYNFYEVAKFLISSGANLSIKNNAGYAAEIGLHGGKSIQSIALKSAVAMKEIIDALEAYKQGDYAGLDRVELIRACLRLRKKTGPNSWSEKLKNEVRAALHR